MNLFAELHHQIKEYGLTNKPLTISPRIVPYAGNQAVCLDVVADWSEELLYKLTANSSSSELISNGKGIKFTTCYSSEGEELNFFLFTFDSPSVTDEA
jgi:hypothetical protein